MARFTLLVGSRQHKLLRLGIAAVGAIVLLALPLNVQSIATIDMFSQLLAYMVAILGLTLLTGLCGQISIGHSAFVGLGAYTTLILVVDNGWPYLATIPVAVALCMIAGALVGIPALRISGIYLAVVTLSIAALFPTLVDLFEGITGGTNGKFAQGSMMAPDWFPIDLNTRKGPAIFHYWVILAIAVLMFWVAHNITRSRIGRALVAIRDSPYSASAAGIKVARYKVFVFAVSAGFAGVAGSLLMIQLPQATDARFDLYLSIFLLIGLIAGGRATIWGAIPGAIVFILLRTYIPDWVGELNLFADKPEGGQIVGIVSGALLIGFAFLLPDGVMSGLTRVARRFVRIVRPEPAGWEQYRSAPSPASSSAGSSTSSLIATPPVVHASGAPDGEKKGLQA